MAIFSLTLTSCRDYEVNNADDDYKVFTQKQGIGKFSFEYTNRYKILKVETGDTYTDITLNNPKITENLDSSRLYIFCNMLEDGETGYQNTMEGYFEMARTNIDFKILERSPL
jgi:hypothetical protein